MKFNAKRAIFSILIPAALIMGPVLCAWIYRSQSFAQLDAQKESPLYLPGTPVLCKIDLSDELRFAFAVPYEENGKNIGAVIDFCTEDEIRRILSSETNAVASTDVAFKPSGRIVTKTGAVQAFKDESDIYTYFDKLASVNAVSSADVETLRSTVRAGGKGTIDPANRPLCFRRGSFVLNFIR